jgi:predicted phosphoribosyltransferase
METFADRYDAGRHLAGLLQEYAGRGDALVLALPRGGVPVGYEVAAALGVPLDIFLVRKLGLPGHEELAMGAIASGGTQVLNAEVVRMFHVPALVIRRVAEQELRELQRRDLEYRGGGPPPDVRGRTVILVDDGLATGSTMRAAVRAVREQGAARIVVAVPVASKNSCGEFRVEVDEMVCVLTPDDFFAVGEWYDDFTQTTDQEVKELLERAQHEVSYGIHRT